MEQPRIFIGYDTNWPHDYERGNSVIYEEMEDDLQIFPAVPGDRPQIIIKRVKVNEPEQCGVRVSRYSQPERRYVVEGEKRDEFPLRIGSIVVTIE